MAFLAFLKVLFAPVVGYLAKNGLALAVKAAPLATLLALFGYEYLTGDRSGLFRLAAVAVAAIHLTLELSGKLPPGK